MNALSVLAGSRVWVPVIGVAAVLTLIYFAYLAAVVNPEQNLEALPVANVNDDLGQELTGKGSTSAIGS